MKIWLVTVLVMFGFAFSTVPNLSAQEEEGEDEYSYEPTDEGEDVMEEEPVVEEEEAPKKEEKASSKKEDKKDEKKENKKKKDTKKKK